MDCVYIPQRGSEIFQSLLSYVGRKKAIQLYYIALNPTFQSTYEQQLTLENGIPSFESFISIPLIQDMITQEDILGAINAKYHNVTDTMDNYAQLLNQAYQFNQENKDFIADVIHTDKGLKIQVTEPNEITKMEFNDKYSTYQLNKRLETIFKDLGITAGLLTETELGMNQYGVTQFDNAKILAGDFTSIVRVANNSFGAKALSEEFSHMIIGTQLNDTMVQRAIKFLSQNEAILREIIGESYDQYLDSYNNNLEWIAEEALGKLLQDSLLKANQGSSSNILDRALKSVISKFKGYNDIEIQNSISEVEKMLNTLASDILSGSKTITKDDIINTKTNRSYYYVEEKASRNLEILERFTDIERKRLRISSDEEVKESSELLIDKLSAYNNSEVNAATGLMLYTKEAVIQMRALQEEFASINEYNTKQVFNLLKKTKIYLDSYGSITNDLKQALLDDANNNNTEEGSLLRSITVDGEEVKIKEVLDQLVILNDDLKNSFAKHSIPAFAKFLKKFLPEDFTINYGSRKGDIISIDKLLTVSEFDISFFDRWLDAMGDSSDALLQLIDDAVKASKDKARQQSILDIKHLQSIRIYAEQHGVKDFDFMFERDNEGNLTGNFVTNINWGQFNKDKKAFEQYLDEKYGKNPTRDKWKAKKNERKLWRQTHTDDMGFPSEQYLNKAFTTIQNNGTLKTIYDNLMDFKQQQDAKLPEGKVDFKTAVQVRKNGTQRLMDSLSSVSSLYKNISEDFASQLLDREDDDQVFGSSKTTKGLTDFSGREYLTLPILYTHRLKNPNELSTDVIGSLMQYSYMANRYSAMDEIIDPLEIGRDIIENRDIRRTKESRGDKQVQESFLAKGKRVVNQVFKANGVNNIDRFEDYREAQVFQRYLKDSGSFDFLGKSWNKQKLASFVLKHSSIAQLGFNWLANMANALTGSAMTNIEAASGEYFNPKELLQADKIYAQCMADYMKEFGARNKTSKIALFDELFDIKQNMQNLVKDSQRSSVIQRFLNSEWAFIGQEAGDHWLYNRVAIAMCLRQQVEVTDDKGNKTIKSLWDVLQKKGIDKEGNTFVLALPKGARLINNNALRGNTEQEKLLFFGRQIAEINHKLFGIYNEDDASAANRLAMGRLLLQYRKWMKPALNYRFQKGQYNSTLGKWEEGYYRTAGRLLGELVAGKRSLTALWSTLNPEEKANIIRVLTELSQCFALFLLADVMEWPDDKHRPYALKLAEYACKRTYHECAQLTPSLGMLREGLKTVQQPLPSLGVATSYINLVSSVFTPSDWTDEISQGEWKGYTKLEANVAKAPLPIYAYYKQIQKFTGQIDKSIGFFDKP